MRHIQTMRIFEGPVNARLLALDSSALSEGLYRDVGVIIVLSIIHGGPPPRFMSELLYQSLVADHRQLTPTLIDIHDTDLKAQIQELMACTSTEEIETWMNRDGRYNLLFVSGCVRPILSMADKDRLVTDLVRFIVLRRSSEGRLQLLSGLETLGLLATMKLNPQLFRELFVFNVDAKLTSDAVEAIFHDIKYSPKGSNKRPIEEKVISYWRDLLIDVEEEQSEGIVTLHVILVFATGSDVVPPLGFDPMPSISFRQEQYPTANTCGLILNLPLVPSTYNDFKTNMLFGIANSPGFGMA